MKKFLIIIFALIGLVSCSKQIAGTDGFERTITFKNSVERKITTKANKGIIANTTFSYDDFGVYGYVKPNSDAIASESETTNGGYLAKNAKYIKSGSIWVPESGYYYWPKADNLSDIEVNFVAYAPYVANDGFDSTNDTITIPIDATDMGANCVDVLYAHKENVNPTGEPVALLFNHALSWIEFQGKYANNVKEVKITSIKFSSVLKGKGNLVLNVKNFSQTVTDKTYDIDPNFCDNIVLTAQDDGTGSVAYEVLSDMLVIPQDVPTQVTITFNITLENTSGDEIHYNGRTVTRTINNGPDANKQNDASTGRDFVSTFEGGKKYVYRIFVTANDITFNVNVDTWDEENPFQVWDHNTTAYVEHFFGEASMLMVKNSVIA